MLNFIKKTKVNSIPINEIDKLIEKAEVIDIREPYEYKSGSISSAKNIPMGNLLANPQKYLSQDKTYYLMCQSGGRSSMAARDLTKQGYKVINMDGGIISYTGTHRN